VGVSGHRCAPSGIAGGSFETAVGAADGGLDKKRKCTLGISGGVLYPYLEHVKSTFWENWTIKKMEKIHGDAPYIH